MKIGMLIDVQKSTDIKAKFREIRDNDMQCCQLAFWDLTMYNDEVAKTICEARDETGIEIVAVWAGWTGPIEWNFEYGPTTLGIVPPAYRFMRQKELMAGADFAEKIGVDCVVTHLGFLPENLSDPEYYGVLGTVKYLAEYMKAKNQKFLFETGEETPVVMLRMIEDIGLDNLGINFDTANLMSYGKGNSVDALRVFGKYVVNTHCKDGFYPTNGRDLGVEVPLGEGLADMPTVYRMLMELGYDGPFVIEREITGPQQMIDILKARDYLRQIEKEYNESKKA